MPRDIYQEITDKIMAELEAGVQPWAKPWADAKFPTAAVVPTNFATGKPYRGINVPLLWMTGHEDMRFMTFKQGQSIGATVRKGERGHMVVFFKRLAVHDATKPDDDDAKRTIPMLRMFTVFHVSQFDGIPEAPAPKATPITYTEAQRMAGLATVVHGGNRAFYRRTTDTIHLPQPGQFKSEADYHATALHELTHWTGAESRCNREFGKRFGDNAYAFEELVAEMGAAFLCATAGIGYQAQHAQYLQSWLKVLKADKRAIVHAASKAQAAVDHVTAALALAEQAAA